jgi:hypothetical protein
MSRIPKPVKSGDKYPIWRWGITPEDHILHLEILMTERHKERGERKFRQSQA